VSLLLRHSTARTAAFRSLNPVGFHRSSRLILLTTTIHFSGLDHAACALASPLLRTPPLDDRTSVLLQVQWLTFDLSGLALQIHQAHPLGNNDKFQGITPYSNVPSLARRDE
jgi:hypothetical protein